LHSKSKILEGEIEAKKVCVYFLSLSLMHVFEAGFLGSDGGGLGSTVSFISSLRLVILDLETRLFHGEIEGGRSSCLEIS
jgi:hypothetical protein